MKINFRYALLAFTLGCSAPILAAETGLLSVSSLFTQMDIDKDGVIKPDEVNKQSMLSNEFSRVDQNSDGSLDPKEFEIFIAKVGI